MSQFTTDFVGKLIGKNLWEVYEPFEYHVGKYPSDIIIQVPVKFITDFASVPRIFWSIISPIDEHGKAAVLHDYLYYTGFYSRKKSDLIFLEALEVLKVKKWKRICMYYSVRLFGWYAWCKWRIKKRYKGGETIKWKLPE